MDVIITGAANRTGKTLASALLAASRDIASLTLTDKVEPLPPEVPASLSHIAVRCVKADLTSFRDCKKLFTRDIDMAYLLHGRPETDLDLGLKMNVDSMRQILDIMRRHGNPRVRVVFASSLAVYGPNTAGELVSEETVPLPRLSFGTQELITEALLNDYSRRGLVDGRILRLPTFTFWLGPSPPPASREPSTLPTSSSTSGIPREPLEGEESILPVRKDLKMWICSSRVVIENLIKAMFMPKEKYAGRHSRTVNMPGQTVTIREMLDASEKMNGEQVRELFEDKRGRQLEKLPEILPDRVDTALAKSLGFTDDVPYVEAVQAHIEDHGYIRLIIGR